MGKAEVDALIQGIEAKKTELHGLRRRVPNGLANFQHAHNLELTYTSNAIEGNTLTASETMLVVEQGIAIGGKPPRNHLEAIDHHEAVLYSFDRQAHDTIDREGCAQLAQPDCETICP
jgi:Fic family protein